MLDSLSHSWPWYLTGPLMGAVAVALLLYGNRMLGVSGSYRAICAAVAPGRIDFFRFDWRGTAAWNLAFVCGIALGGFLGVHLLGTPGDVAISAAARAELAALGITDFTGMVPSQLYSWRHALSVRGLLGVGGGGFLVGFGAFYAGGCTSGHGILGLADRQLPSLVAVTGFFVGGLLSARLLLPFVI